MNIKKIYSLYSKKELTEELIRLRKGCGSKVDSYGDCWHIHTYNPKYCNKCKRRMLIIQQIIDEM